MDGREAFRNSGSVILLMQVDSAIIAKEQNSSQTVIKGRPIFPKSVGNIGRSYLFVQNIGNKLLNKNQK